MFIFIFIYLIDSCLSHIRIVQLLMYLETIVIYKAKSLLGILILFGSIILQHRF